MDFITAKIRTIMTLIELAKITTPGNIGLPKHSYNMDDQAIN